MKLLPQDIGLLVSREEMKLLPHDIGLLVSREEEIKLLPQDIGLLVSREEEMKLLPHDIGLLVSREEEMKSVIVTYSVYCPVEYFLATVYYVSSFRPPPPPGGGRRGIRHRRWWAVGGDGEAHASLSVVLGGACLGLNVSSHGLEINTLPHHPNRFTCKKAELLLYCVLHRSPY